MRTLLAIALGVVAAGAAAQEGLPGNLPWLWSRDIGSWGAAGTGGRVEVFTSAVDEDRAVGALGVIWYRMSDDGAKIAQVRYPALICGGAFFGKLELERSHQPSADEIDLVLTLDPLPDAPAAAGPGGEVTLRVVNSTRSVQGIHCPG